MIATTITIATTIPRQIRIISPERSRSMMRRGADINIGQMSTFPFYLNGSASINSTKPKITFSNKVDLRYGGMLNSNTNVELTIVELGARSAFGRIKEVSLKGPTNLSGSSNQLRYVKVSGKVDMTSYARVSLRNSTISDGTTFNIPFRMREIPTITIFGKESSSNVTVNFNYICGFRFNIF